MSQFSLAIDYILGAEGGYSNLAADHGGATNYGITQAEALAHRIDIQRITRDEAVQIYQADYWKFDNVTDQRVATKMLDMVVNFGVAGGTKLVQKAVGTTEDGVYGPATEAAVNALDPDVLLENLSLAACDHYIDICLANHTQLVFLRGWIRRGVRRPQAV